MVSNRIDKLKDVNFVIKWFTYFFKLEIVSNDKKKLLNGFCSLTIIFIDA